MELGCRDSLRLHWLQFPSVSAGQRESQGVLRGSSRPSSSVTANTYTSSDEGLEGADRRGVFLKLKRKFMFEENRDTQKLFCLIILILAFVSLVTLQYRDITANISRCNDLIKLCVPISRWRLPLYDCTAENDPSHKIQVPRMKDSDYLGHNDGWASAGPH